MNQRILKNANGWIEIQRAEDDEIIYLFDPTGMIVSSHPSEPNAVTISKTPSNQDPNESIVIYMLEEDELTVSIGENSYVIDSAPLLKEKLALLFSKGGGNGNGVAPYRELYGRIEWDANTQKPVMVVEHNTLGFVPAFSNQGGFYIFLDVNSSNSLHSSISSIDKVHFYATKRVDVNREVIFEYGIYRDDNYIYLQAQEKTPITSTQSVDFDINIPSSSQNINQTISFQVNVNGNLENVSTNVNFNVDIPSYFQSVSEDVNVPDTLLLDKTLTDGLCDNGGDNFFHTKFRIVVLD